MCVEWDGDGFPKSAVNPFKIPESSAYSTGCNFLQSEHLSNY